MTMTITTITIINNNNAKKLTKRLENILMEDSRY